jgi:DNA polymerase III delta prime subunit
LFIGPEGTGTLAMAVAYAQYIVSQNKAMKTKVKFQL